jgi:hypothetical protein
MSSLVRSILIRLAFYGRGTGHDYTPGSLLRISLHYFEKDAVAKEGGKYWCEFPVARL